jgi:hypothetical protein
MKTTLATYDIANALCADEFASWTRAGALALAEHLEEMEEATGEEMELDVVAIRCDFAEYESLIDWATNHFGGAGSWQEPVGVDCYDLSEEDTDTAIRDFIHENGILIEFDDGVIVSSF